jgi:hypothetical protein
MLSSNYCSFHSKLAILRSYFVQSTFWSSFSLKRILNSVEDHRALILLRMEKLGKLHNFLLIEYIIKFYNSKKKRRISMNYYFNYT